MKRRQKTMIFFVGYSQVYFVPEKQHKGGFEEVTLFFDDIDFSIFFGTVGKI